MENKVIKSAYDFSRYTNRSTIRIKSAYDLLHKSVLYYEGIPVGTAAAVHSAVHAANYEECFIRDFVPSALVFLMDVDTEIVKNFLNVVVNLRGQQTVMEGHERADGLMQILATGR